ncbi:MAG: hypothetical protein RL318_472 [Fibrobacterota bacterium]
MDPVRFRALSNGERMEFGLAAPPSLLRVVLEVPFPGRWWFVSELRTPRRLEIRLGSNVLGPFGESRPFKERPVATTDLAIPLDLKGPIDTLFLLVEEPKGPCVLKAHFTPDRLLPGEVEARTFGNGLILGYMLAIFLVSGFLWLAVREKAFGWYVAYFAAALAWLAVKRGSAFAWVWPDHPAWNDGASVALAYLAMGCFALFLVHILELPRHLPRLARALTVGACIEFFLLPIAFFCLLNFNRMALTLVGWFQVILPLTMLGALLHRAFSRDRLALWLLIAFLPLALGMIYGVLVEFGFSAAGPASKAFVLAVGALCENTMTTLILIREVHRRERARLALEREFHAKVVEQADGYFREVAQELHDDLGQRTFSMRMQLFAQGAALTDSDRRLAETVDSLHKDLRKLSRRLHPPQLRENGLQDALEDLCRGFDAESGMQVRLVCTPGLPELPVAANLHLYRIVQESLVNAHRHGGATEVELALIRIPGGVRLAVTDNGNGFDSEVVEGGLGMAGMSSRAQAMGGQFVVRSRVGHGTRLQLDLPLEGKGGYA